MDSEIWEPGIQHPPLLESLHRHANALCRLPWVIQTETDSIGSSVEGRCVL
jgi:hypothetical protein